jgi:transposase InsO family protein
LITLAPAHLTRSGACELLAVARSGFYRAQQPPGAPALARHAARVRLRDRIEALCLQFPGYGYRRVLRQLWREDWQVGKHQVQAIMQEESLQCQVRRSWIGTTHSGHACRRYPNLGRGLTVTGINQLWVADITYIRLQTQFLYLAVLLDSY